MRPPGTSVSHGVLHSVIDKLEKPTSWDGLSTIEGKKILDLKQTIKELMDDYPKPSGSQASAAVGSRFWVKEVRNLSYDIDDFIDKLVHTIDHQRNPRRKVSKIVKLRESRRRRGWIVNEVSRFRACLEEAIRWRQPGTVASDIDPPVPPPHPPSTVPSEEGPVVPDLYEMAPARLVGIESSVSKIGGWLTHQGEDQQLRVISLVGSGGIGKTTLARQLNDNFGRQFHSRAFVQSSKKPDMKRLLTSILRQIQPYCPADVFESCNLIVDAIRERLRHKKYVFRFGTLCIFFASS
jgi:hypothetical protein